MKYLSFFCVLLFFGLMASAQVKKDTIRQVKKGGTAIVKKDSTHYHINLMANGSLNQANGQNTYLLNNALNLGIKSKAFNLNFTNTWVCGQQNNLLTNNDYSSLLYFDLNTKHKDFYYWALVNYNTSYSLKIDEQLLTGAGVAYRILNYKNAHLSVSDGALLDESSLFGGINYHTYRNSFRTQFHFAMSEHFTLDGSDFIQNSVENIHDYIIRSTTTFSYKLKKWIALTTALNYNKETITQSDNLLFTYGVTIDRLF
jgi:hypothetical protein